MTAVVLALEASQRHGGVAVEHGGRTDVEWMSADVRHDDDLLPAIVRLYERCALAPGMTDAVGVSIGPGGFTGLRIAVSTGKMMAEATGAKIVAVPTALVVAESHDGSGPLIVALASKDGTAWVTRLARDEIGCWATEGDGRLVDAAAVPLDGAETLLADRYLPQPFRDRCHQAGVPIVEPDFSPLGCLAVAVRLFEKSQTTDPLRLEPIYARAPSAVALRDQSART